MTRKIYLVEDEKSLNILLSTYLEREGYVVTAFFDGKSALEKVTDIPDMWILDIMLPDKELDGYDLIKKIKELSNTTPVIFMSARNEELDRVVGLELGSDDYLSKPFLPRELVIRVNRLMERVYGEDSNLEEINYICGYKVSKNQRAVFLEGEEISLTGNEYELLNYFIINKNNALTREQILNKVWGFDYFGSDRVVDDTIRRLRKKLENLELDTVYGYGYKLVIKS